MRNRPSWSPTQLGSMCTYEDQIVFQFVKKPERPHCLSTYRVRMVAGPNGKQTQGPHPQENTHVTSNAAFQVFW